MILSLDKEEVEKIVLDYVVRELKLTVNTVEMDRYTGPFCRVFWEEPEKEEAGK
jgi:hypothetical protein